MVLVDDAADRSLVIGYHTLLMVQVRQEEIPGDKPRIKRNIPAILLGQLGVDRAFQGRAYGELLLTDAQARVHEISENAGVRALMLDAQAERLASWYAKHGCMRFPGKLRLFKSIQAIRRLRLID